MTENIKKIPTDKKFSYEDYPEFKAQLQPWADKWIANALSTEPTDRSILTDAINGLYKAAKLPLPDHIAFVRSPLALTMAGSMGAAIWWLRENPQEHEGLFGRTVNEGEIRLAVLLTALATLYKGLLGREVFDKNDARLIDSYAAPSSALVSRNLSPQILVDTLMGLLNDPDAKQQNLDTILKDMCEALDAVTLDTAQPANTEMVYSAKTTPKLLVKMIAFFTECESFWYRMYDGGSDWSAYPAYLSFFDRVVHLDLPVYEDWRHYEQAALFGGPRMLHAKFAIVSDRQTAIHLDANNQLHNEDGPAKTFGDGWSLNYWHGVLVPYDFFEWDTERAMQEPNAEIRRCAIERLGWNQFTESLSLIAEAPDPGNEPHMLRLYRGKMLDSLYEQPAHLLIVHNGSIDKGGTRRQFGLPVPATVKDPVEAAAMLYDIPVETYRQLARRT